MVNRREFVAAVVSSTTAAAAQTVTSAQKEPDGTSVAARESFPAGDYTPYGYLDNPFHTWNLHPSGVLRSLPGMGFGFYFPAGPGGYFDSARNTVYEAHLRVGFLAGERRFWTPEDFHEGELISSYHSKNLFTYQFSVSETRVACTFLQAGEDVLAARVVLDSPSGKRPAIRLMAVHGCRLGGSVWWGRDGLTGSYSRKTDSVSIRSYAAGPVFTLLGNRASRAHFLGKAEQEVEAWFQHASPLDGAFSYFPDPLHGALLYEIPAGSEPKVETTIVLARGSNAGVSLQKARTGLGEVSPQISARRVADSAFWGRAPRLEGDWPKHWKNGWVYDFETLRMMVRRPAGVYRHPWDAMQIQAPRNVLAETSIDMWALSYADPEAAQQVFVGQFLDAPSDNVPCMREDGAMNMVAADGSECGTSISWCYPFFCAASIWRRTRDRRWLAGVYPGLSRLLRWTIAHRTDSGGFIVGKCSWETGMDGSKRFLIHQPTGAELTEFVRVVELQAAAAQAAEVLQEFAAALGDSASVAEWRTAQRTYAARTRELWKDDWFHDLDARSGKAITNVGRDVGQVAPVFCGIADHGQVRAMMPAMRQFFADSSEKRLPADNDWQDALHWSSMVLPYVESLWAAGELELLSRVVEATAERVYASMDRRVLKPSSPATEHERRPLGWPGVSCEIWGAHGAYGGEGYGWGAVLPAHIIRNIAGFRETEKPDRLWIAPNLPPSLVAPGRVYRVRNLRYADATLDLSLSVLDSGRVLVEGAWGAGVETAAVENGSGSAEKLQQAGRKWRFEGLNHSRYLIHL